MRGSIILWILEYNKTFRGFNHDKLVSMWSKVILEFLQFLEPAGAFGNTHFLMWHLPSVVEWVFHVSDFGNGTSCPLFLSWWLSLWRNTSHLCFGYVRQIAFSLPSFPRQFFPDFHISPSFLHHAPGFSQVWVPQGNHPSLDPPLWRNLIYTLNLLKMCERTLYY